jgi:hypothetical protein
MEDTVSDNMNNSEIPLQDVSHEIEIIDELILKNDEKAIGLKGSEIIPTDITASHTPIEIQAGKIFPDKASKNLKVD